jgi:hypothetical protein
MATNKTKKPAAQAPADPLAESRRVVAQYAEDGALTVNGKPLDPDNPDHAKLFFQQTDQGIAAANIAQGRTGSGAKVRSRFEHQIEAREAVADGNLAPWEAPDPLKEAADAHRRPGMAVRALSDRVIKQRGLRKWKPIIGENGDPVKVADMVLGEMPMESAERRNEYYREQGNEAVRQAEEHAREQQEKLIRDGNVVGIKPLKPGETVHDSDNGSRVAVSGLRAQRGNSHFAE